MPSLNAQNTLAVALHFPSSADDTELGFNCWMSFYRATLLDSRTPIALCSP